MSSRNIANPETVEEIRETRGIGSSGGSDAGSDSATDDEEELPGQQASPEELQEARETVADERQPDRSHLPGKEAITLTWRGAELDFDEDPHISDELEAFYESDEKSEAELRKWAVEKLGEMCMDPAADAEYWDQFATNRNDDKDGLVDILLDVAGAPDKEEIEQAQQFRNE